MAMDAFQGLEKYGAPLESQSADHLRAFTDRGARLFGLPGASSHTIVLIQDRVLADAAVKELIPLGHVAVNMQSTRLVMSDEVLEMQVSSEHITLVFVLSKWDGKLSADAGINGVLVC